MVIPFIYTANRELANRQLRDENHRLQNKLSAISNIVNDTCGDCILPPPSKEDILFSDRLNKDLILKGDNYEILFTPAYRGVDFTLKAKFDRFDDYRLILNFSHQDFEKIKSHITKVMEYTINNWKEMDKYRIR